jgi:hypothetical protein
MKPNLASKSEDCFILSIITTILSKLEKEVFRPELEEFHQYVHMFYKTGIGYFCEWNSPFCTVIHLEKMEKTVEFVLKVILSLDIDDSVLYDECVSIKRKS